MSIGGNLRTMPFADLLQWVSQSRKTGTLVIDGPKFKKKLTFNDGTIIATASNNPKELLGYYLVGWKFIDEEELPELLEMQDRYGTLLGELLITIGRIRREDLTKILMAKTEDSLYDIFLWEEGDFQFLDNVLPTMKFEPLNLSVDALIMEGVRRKDEWERMRQSIPDIDWIPRLKHAVDVEQLGPMEVSIIRQLNGQNSIEDVALACRISPFYVAQFIFNGLPQDIFTLTPPSGAPKAIPGMAAAGWRLKLREAEKAIEDYQLVEASRIVRNLQRDFADTRETLEFSKALENQLEEIVKEIGVVGEAIPELAIPLSELTTLNCSPDEGFLLSRINGVYTVNAILKMVPGDSQNNRMMLAELIHKKVLRIKPS